MLFRKRAGSKKRLFSKFRPFRNRSSSKSSILWSVKREKLNEAIYKPRKEKLFKCPHILELENAGKYAPRLTFYLHPYGYEEDAGTNLTLVIELSASVKSNIPSSANIHIEVMACESKEGLKLNEVVLECSANCRILRNKEFLSHDQLKKLECDSIDLQASAHYIHPSSQALRSDLEHSWPSSCDILDNVYTDQQNEEYSPNGVFPNSHPFSASSQAGIFYACLLKECTVKGRPYRMCSASIWWEQQNLLDSFCK